MKQLAKTLHKKFSHLIQQVIAITFSRNPNPKETNLAEGEEIVENQTVKLEKQITFQTSSKRMSEKFLDGIFCHSERNEVERRIPIFRYGWRCNTWLLLRWA
ncbi:hypothetical protein [Nostoc sp.]|uniref:hypothetical protein n=1 Tax=Nostoc sp. TaxID=1180 RepID=UPI002FFB1054